MTYIYFSILLIILGGLFLLYQRARRERDSLRGAMAKLERELRAQAFDENQVSQRLAAVGAASSEAIVICKTDRTVIYMNPAARTLFTVPSDNQSLIAITRQHEIDQLFDEALAGRAPDKQLFFNSRTFRVRAVTFDGGVVIALSDITALQ